MRVFLHTRRTGAPEWRHELRDVAQVPHVGEYVAPAADGPWFAVRLVVHTPFEADCDAEVYAVEVDARRVLGSTVGPER